MRGVASIEANQASNPTRIGLKTTELSEREQVVTLRRAVHAVPLGVECGDGTAEPDVVDERAHERFRVGASFD